jgi:signal transduction histidine kinase
VNLEKIVKERTKELMEAQNRLLKTERLAAIGELAGMVGHDLRNPLTGIKNAAYVLRKKQGSLIGENGNEMLAVIDRAVEQANNIVDDLLDYSREIHLDLEEYSPKSLIDYVLLSVTVPPKVKIIDHTQNSPMIRVDASKMERVFINLIKNAIEAIPDGGTLEIASAENMGDLQITFADTGIGMSEDVLAKLFTPLFTTKSRGIGLGLPICKRIVEAHRGKISVQSLPNKGTTFTIRMPS